METPGISTKTKEYHVFLKGLKMNGIRAANV